MSHSRNAFNIYYTYRLTELDDFSNSTLERRVKKSKQNHANHVYLILENELISKLNHSSDMRREARFSSLLTTLLQQLKDQFKYLSVELSALHTELIDLIVESNILDFIYIKVNKNDQKNLLNNTTFKTNKTYVLLCPQSKEDFLGLIDDYSFFSNLMHIVYWRFEPYNPDTNYLLTIKEIYELKKRFEYRYKIKMRTILGLEIYNNLIPANYELEPEQAITWQMQTIDQSKIKLSIIIPSYNNAQFLSNVIFHLTQQDIDPTNYEVIVVDDGSTDKSSTIIHNVFNTYQNRFNLKYIYWPKSHPKKGSQAFFRAGLARNLGVLHVVSDHILFLDSDMLVPYNFVRIASNALNEHDIIQFKRKHILQKNSFSNPLFSEVPEDQCYIEESHYWNNLFQCADWMSLENFWKYTCTYALGLKKEDFLSLGRFKKYYVSYGLEDTDLGYELFKRNKKFHVVDTYLLHLTSYNAQQYKNSFWKRRKLLKITSKLFYLQHLDENIFHTFLNFYHFEKSTHRLVTNKFLSFVQSTKKHRS